MSETLKIEAGTLWKCRDGNQASVVGRMRSGGVVIERGHGVVVLKSGGVYWGDQPHDFDLMKPWTEPRQWTVYVNEHDGREFATLGKHKCSYEGCHEIAIVEVTEGDGLKEQP